jgi:hypothetical protein
VPIYAQIGLAIGLGLASGVMVVGMYIRLHIQETPEFAAVKGATPRRAFRSWT